MCIRDSIGIGGAGRGVGGYFAAGMAGANIPFVDAGNAACIAVHAVTGQGTLKGAAQDAPRVIPGNTADVVPVGDIGQVAVQHRHVPNGARRIAKETGIGGLAQSPMDEQPLDRIAAAVKHTGKGGFLRADRLPALPVIVKFAAFGKIGFDKF